MNDKPTNSSEGWNDPQRNSGSDQHNPGYAAYERKFNENFKGLRRAESEGDTSSNSTYGAENIRQKEEGLTAPLMPNIATMTNKQKRKNKLFNRNVLQSLITGKKLRKNSSVFALLLLLFGGGSMLTVLFSPALAIINMKEVLTDSLNDQMRAMDERSSVLLRSKLKDVTKGSCGAVKIKCRFASMSDRQAAKFEKAGIQIERDMSRGFGANRGQITKMSFINDRGVQTVVTSADQLQREVMGNMPFRSAMLKGHNPQFAGFTDRVALNVLQAIKASKRVVATGANDEERRNRVNQAVSGIEDSGARPLIRAKDENNRDIYVDENGNRFTQTEVDAAREQSGRIDEYTRSGGMNSVLSTAVKGAAIHGAADSACTVYNSMRFVSALAKVKKQAQASRYAMAMVLVPADSIKAGDAKEDDISYIGNNLTAIRPEGTVLDESKLSVPGSAENPATISDPEAGKSAFDSPGYKIAAHNDTPDLSLRASKFMIAGGSVALFDGVLRGIATIVNGGDPNPKAVSQKCKYIQHPAVRFTGLAIGIIAGIGSFGLVTALSVGGSIAIAMALPYIESNAADILSGNVFKNLSGIDSGDAAYVGAAGLLGMMAMKRGMKPLNKQEGMEYLAASKQTLAKYHETEAYLARSTPFDINNRFSFMGSIAHSILPLIQTSKSSASMAALNVTRLIPLSFDWLFRPAKAASISPTYFDKCNDQGYASIGVACGPFGELRYGLSEEELAMDDEENAQWMADTGNIDPDSETGEAKDNGQSWNYVKFLKQCVNRTTPMGEYQDESEGDGSNCVAPDKESLNKHFRVYTIDKSIDTSSLDGERLSGGLPGTDGSLSGETGTVDTTGWAFPTPADMTITSGYMQNRGSYHHKGIDIAGRGSAATRGKPIFAARDGVVRAAGPAQGFGNWIVIEHQAGGKTMSSVYGHMEADGVLVRVGESVKAGQQIGKIGNAGDSSGPHLHFEIWEGSPLGGFGSTVNPLDYVKPGAPARNQESTSV